MDRLKGGKADKIPPARFPTKKVREGAKVEREHTSNKLVAAEIARDHLTEDPNYYAKLKEMEKSAQADGLFDELSKISIDFTSLGIDPLSAAAGMAGGKIMLSNAVNRYGHKLKPFSWLGKEVAGVGVRTGMQGKPMLSRPLREIMGIGIDPHMVGVYEKAHGAGRVMKALGPGGVQKAQDALHSLSEVPIVKKTFPDSATMGKFISKIPTQSTGVRKIVDYGFTPVSQVGKDIGRGVSSLASRAGAGLRRLVR